MTLNIYNGYIMFMWALHLATAVKYDGKIKPRHVITTIAGYMVLPAYYMAGFFKEIHWPQLTIAFFFMLGVISDVITKERTPEKSSSFFFALAIVITIASFGGLWG